METYYGHVKTPSDAIILFEACRLGHLPRVQRRLSEKERQQIRSGSVFVWDEREAGMRRWTDGKSWSASRVSGSFLTYREMEGKRGGSNFSSPMQGVVPTSSNGSDKSKSNDGEGGSDGQEGYRYKPDGLMKQSFSITTSGNQHLHLISYYARSDPSSVTLTQPTNDSQLRSIRPEKGMYPESTMHDAPPVTRSPMTASPFGTSPRDRVQQNYLRHPPPSAGYPWPPSPMETPPTHYGHGTPYQQNLSTPGSVNASPMYYNRGYPPQGRQPGLTAFDRPPPPMSSSTLPLPPPPPPSQPSSYYQSASSASGYQPSQPSQPAATLPPPPTSSLSYPPLSSSSDYSAPGPPAGFPPPNSYSHYSPSLAPIARDGSHQYTSSPYGPPSGYGSSTNIDPRLNPHQQQQQQQQQHSQHPPSQQSYVPPNYDLPPPPPPSSGPPPLSSSNHLTNGVSPPLLNTSNLSKTIPSITSLMNPTSPLLSPRQQQHHRNSTDGLQDHDPRHHNKNGGNIIPKIEPGSYNSTPDIARGQQPQKSLPHHHHHPESSMESKMGFGEDSRILRRLDRAFAA